MRRLDHEGGVYEQVIIDRSTGMAQNRNAPQSLGVFSGNNTTAVGNAFAGKTTRTTGDAIESANADVSRAIYSNRDVSSTIFLEAIEKFGSDDMLDVVGDDIFDDASTTLGSSNTSMYGRNDQAIPAYITFTGGRNPNEKSIKGMIELLEPVTTENMTALWSMIKDLSSDADELVSFFDDTFIE